MYKYKCSCQTSCAFNVIFSASTKILLYINFSVIWQKLAPQVKSQKKGKLNIWRNISRSTLETYWNFFKFSLTIREKISVVVIEGQVKKILFIFCINRLKLNKVLSQRIIFKSVYKIRIVLHFNNTQKSIAYKSCIYILVFYYHYLNME